MQRAPTTAALAALAALACGPAGTGASSSPGAGPTAPLLGVPELVARGFVVQPVDRSRDVVADGQLGAELARDADARRDPGVVVCAPGAAECICVEALAAPVPELADELAKLREMADAGDCGAERARACDVTAIAEDQAHGASERFYVGGRLVGEIVSTDVPEYCDQRASRMLVGRVPDCAAPLAYVRSACEHRRSSVHVSARLNVATLLR